MFARLAGMLRGIRARLQLDAEDLPPRDPVDVAHWSPEDTALPRRVVALPRSAAPVRSAPPVAADLAESTRD